MRGKKKLQFGDGGPIYYPRRPQVVLPGQRAAARFLLEVERLAPEVVQSLREDVLPFYHRDEILQRIELVEPGPRVLWPCASVYYGLLGRPPGEMRVTAGMVRMVEVAPTDTPQWRRSHPRFPALSAQLGHWSIRYTFNDLGECHWVPATEPGIEHLVLQGWAVGRQRKPTREEAARLKALLDDLRTAADRYDAEDQRRLNDSCTPQLGEWAKRYYLLGPHVTRVILRVLDGWKYADELPKEPGRWGVRMEFLADERRTRQLFQAREELERARQSGRQEEIDEAQERYSEFPRGIDRSAVVIPRFHIDLPGWDFEIEPWCEAKERFHAAFEEALERQRSQVEDRQSRGWEPVPFMLEERHFEWLVRRQVHGWRPKITAERCGVGSEYTVRNALKRCAKLMELPLRPVPPGPSGDLDLP